MQSLILISSPVCCCAPLIHQAEFRNSYATPREVKNNKCISRGKAENLFQLVLVKVIDI